MMRINKALSLKIISLAVSVCVLSNSLLYASGPSFKSNKDILRVPVGGNVLQGRLIAAKDSLTEAPLYRTRLPILALLGIAAVSTTLFMFSSCNNLKESYMQLAHTDPNEALMRFEEYKDKPFVLDVVMIAMENLGDDVVIDNFHNYPEAFWGYAFSEIWKNGTKYGNKEENLAGDILRHIAEGTNQNQKKNQVRRQLSNHKTNLRDSHGVTEPLRKLFTPEAMTIN